MSSNPKNSRRSFIRNTAKAGLALTSLGVLPDSLIANSKSIKIFGTPGSANTGFDQTPLPYGYNALEPSIDAMTMEIHYTKHASAYAKNLKEAAQAEKIDLNKPLEDVLAKVSSYSAKVRNNGGGHYNHELFWKSMKASGEGKPSAKLLAAIEKDFNSFEAFKTQFNDAGKNRFGSGWAWLFLDGDKKLRIGSTPNQDNPLMDVAEVKGTPILGVDVWEHAYYLKYQNRRADYLNAFCNVVNWDNVAARLK